MIRDDWDCFNYLDPEQASDVDLRELVKQTRFDKYLEERRVEGFKRLLSPDSRALKRPVVRGIFSRLEEFGSDLEGVRAVVENIPRFKLDRYLRDVNGFESRLQSLVPVFEVGDFDVSEVSGLVKRFRGDLEVVYDILSETCAGSDGLGVGLSDWDWSVYREHDRVNSDIGLLRRVDNILFAGDRPSFARLHVVKGDYEPLGELLSEAVRKYPGEVRELVSEFSSDRVRELSEFLLDSDSVRVDSFEPEELADAFLEDKSEGWVEEISELIEEVSSSSVGEYDFRKALHETLWSRELEGKERLLREIELLMSGCEDGVLVTDLEGLYAHVRAQGPGDLVFDKPVSVLLDEFGEQLERRRVMLRDVGLVYDSEVGDFMEGVVGRMDFDRVDGFNDVLFGLGRVMGYAVEGDFVSYFLSLLDLGDEERGFVFEEVRGQLASSDSDGLLTVETIFDESLDEDVVGMIRSVPEEVLRSKWEEYSNSAGEVISASGRFHEYIGAITGIPYYIGSASMRDGVRFRLGEQVLRLSGYDHMRAIEFLDRLSGYDDVSLVRVLDGARLVQGEGEDLVLRFSEDYLDSRRGEVADLVEMEAVCGGGYDVLRREMLDEIRTYRSVHKGLSRILSEEYGEEGVKAFRAYNEQVHEVIRSMEANPNLDLEYFAKGFMKEYRLEKVAGKMVENYRSAKGTEK